MKERGRGAFAGDETGFDGHDEILCRSGYKGLDGHCAAKQVFGWQ